MKNIVFILTDQQRYDSLGCNGNAYVRTPQLDRLASEGLNLHRHISVSAICMPSRASIVTGLHQSTHGVTTNGIPLPRAENFHTYGRTAQEVASGKPVFSHRRTMVDWFGEHGYQTVSVGKLHLTPTQSHAAYGHRESEHYWEQHPEMHDWHGPYYGFQHVDLSQGHGDHQKGHYLKWLKERDPEFSKRELPALEFPDIGDLHPGIHSLENHPTTWCREKACEWIEDLRDPEMPFFLWVGIPDPHHPFTPPQELAREAHHREVAMDHVGFDALQRLPQEFSAEATEYVKPIDENRIRRIRQYTDVMVEMIDETVGKIRDSLEKSGILDDTIIVFTSDHGDFLGDYNLLRKCSAASGFLHRVPGIIWGAGSGCLTGETDSPTSSLDWFPTLCEEAGIPVPPDLHGVALGSRMGPLSDEGPAVMSQNFPTAECRLNMTIYEGVYRLTFYPRTGTIELYNSEADPEELRNLAQEPSLVMLIQHLKARLLENTAWASHPNQGRVAAW